MATMKVVKVKLKENGHRFFRFSGIASSESRDSYGEIIKQDGINLSLVKQGKAVVTAEHGSITIGRIEYAEIRNDRLYIEGVVYLKTIRAKQFHDLLTKDDPNNPVTLSVEFVNPIHDQQDKSILNEVVLTGVALIGLESEPANKDTYAQLLKSISKADLLNELCRRANGSQTFKMQLLILLAQYK